MEIDDTLSYLDEFEKNLEEWKAKFDQDKNHRWFTSYVFMSEKMKDTTRINITPITEYLTEAKPKFGEFFESKDISYHIDMATNYCNEIKNNFRVILKLYSDQQDYAKIRVEWNILFPIVSNLIKNLRGRLLIIKRILSG